MQHARYFVTAVLVGTSWLALPPALAADYPEDSYFAPQRYAAPPLPLPRPHVSTVNRKRRVEVVVVPQAATVVVPGAALDAYTRSYANGAPPCPCGAAYGDPYGPPAGVGFGFGWGGYR